ncbi:P-loop containing nucleoside triphosphate hydrolase protein [Hypoxylon sp. FL1150]|nr:P-loop containing nucleoside triphosphate hydrolase protein [Hypoxylon sp. FL1150]
MATRMATRRTHVKDEPRPEPASPSESSLSGTVIDHSYDMPPPSEPPPKKRRVPHDGYPAPPSSVAPSIVAASDVPSFIRSHAPSAETFQRNTEDPEPMFMEMRRRSRHSTPSSQAADASFAQQSFAHPTFTDIGLKQKACNDTLGILQTLGVPHVAAALPELVLVGDQSSGKSSLMSGLARVNLPRSAGVCTRCPLHIRLISSSIGRWSCTVSLQQDYNFQPFPNRKPRTTDVTKANPFPPWVKMPHRDTKTFKTIFDPDEIEEVLRWAQIAILNHNQSFERFIPHEGDIATNTSLDKASCETDAEFSPNIVALEIKGPELPDLSFYDLPGVFMAPEKEEDEYVVKVVKNLSLEYIGRDKAIILWAFPMNVDPENSISLAMIRSSKATDRTIGVMTKADQFPPQNTSRWLSMFRGEKQFVEHGYFATARPPNRHLEDAALWEKSFFNGEACGSNTWPEEFAEYADRCGVDVLLQYLSHQLGDAFARNLPLIKDSIYSRMQLIERELTSLPELPRNVEHEVKKSLIQFLQHMKTTMAPKSTPFSSKWNTLNEQFRDCVKRMKPKCNVKDSETQTIDISSADSEAPTPAATPKRPRPSDSTMRNPTTPSKRQRQDAPSTPVKQEDVPMRGISRASSVVGTSVAESRDDPFTMYHHLGRSFMNIKEIRDDILRNKRPGMPQNLVPQEVRDALCQRAVEKWTYPLETYIKKTAEILENEARVALDQSLGGLRQRLIFRECERHLSSFIALHVASQRGHLTEMLNSEAYTIFVLNDEAFEAFKAAEMEELERMREILRQKAMTYIDWGYPIKSWDKMSRDEKLKERKMLDAHRSKLPSDPFATEIGVAGFVRGYYMMAAARFVEGVAMNVNSTLLRTFRENELDEYMDNKFHIYGHADPSFYSKMMEEDENTAKKREQYKAERIKLVKAMHSINNLERSSGGVRPVHVAIDSDSEMGEGYL